MQKYRPIDVFKEYFLDTKPYHTKILELIEQYKFSDHINCSISDSAFFDLTYANGPLCKPTGYGFIWDGDCGFDVIECCDLFDCIGGYGIIFDNSDLVAEYPIESIEEDEDILYIEGNVSYDARHQIESVPSTSSLRVNGDLTQYFEDQKIFMIVPVKTLQVKSNTNSQIVLSDDHTEILSDKNVFRLYNTRSSDGVYNIYEYDYDIATNETTVTVLPHIADNNYIEPDLTNAIFEVAASTKNAGIYKVETSYFDGTLTTIEVYEDTPINFNNTDEGFNHGSVQLRTGMLANRYITINGTGTDDDTEYKIINSVYEAQSNLTKVTLASDIQNDFTAGEGDEAPVVRMYGYVHDGGFSGRGECSTPQHSNLAVGFSEKLVIEYNQLIYPSQTPTSTVTPTPTSTVTPTSTSVVTPTPTSTVTPTPTPSGIPMYSTTAKAIEGEFPDYQSYDKNEMFAGEDNSYFTFAAFMLIPHQTANYEGLIFTNSGTISLYTRYWGTTPGSGNPDENAFSIWLQNSSYDGYNAVTKGVDDHGINTGEWFALMISADLSGVSANVQVYIQKVGSSVATDITPVAPWIFDDTCPCNIYYSDTSSLTCLNSHPYFGPQSLDSEVCEFYLTNEYLDWSIQANRDKYIDSNGKPVGLGVDGSDLTGTAPKFYFPDGDGTNNRGTAGNFVEIGTIANALTSPTD